MTQWLTANWMVALIGGVVYLATTVVCFTTAKFSPVIRDTDVDAASVLAESWHFKNPELDQMLEELKVERDALAAREQQLKDFEVRLNIERQEIGAVTQAVLRLQRELDETVQRIQEEEVPNLKKLAKLYASMSPEGAANIFTEQPDDEVVKALYYLKPGESGPILEAFARLGKAESQRAAQLTERLRRTMESATQN